MPLPEASERDAALRPHGRDARRVDDPPSGPRGPVHLNFPFREPLVPAAYEPQRSRTATRPGRGTPTSPTSAWQPRRRSAIDAAAWQPAQRGVIVCGHQRLGLSARRPRATWLAALGFPVLADPLSRRALRRPSLRPERHRRLRRLPAHAAALAERLEPDLDPALRRPADLEAAGDLPAAPPRRAADRSSRRRDAGPTQTSRPTTSSTATPDDLLRTLGAASLGAA